MINESKDFTINAITNLEKETGIILQPSILQIIGRRVLIKMTGHTNTPQVEMDCFTPIQVIETIQFVLHNFGHYRDHFSVETGFLSVESIIMKPREVD